MNTITYPCANLIKVDITQYLCIFPELQSSMNMAAPHHPKPTAIFGPSGVIDTLTDLGFDYTSSNTHNVTRNENID